VTDQLVLTEVRADGVATLRLNRPPMNALSTALLTAIGDAAERLGGDASVKAVVVLGGEKAFAAGADISEFGDQAAAREIGAVFRRAYTAVGAIPRPVIAAIGGYALGGGLELAMACDLRIMSDRAKVGQPEILLGIIPGAGGTQRLARIVGPARAKELIWSGRQLRSDEALSLGIVDRVAPNDELESAALAWASELAAGAVVAMGLAKRAIDQGLDAALDAGLDIEDAAFIEVFGTEDAANGVQSFLEHGPGRAHFEGR
jgi:enoyl-CoA hydratase/carnithine racemase